MTSNRSDHKDGKPRVERRWAGQHGWRWERTRHVDRGFAPDWQEGDPPTIGVPRRLPTGGRRGRPHGGPQELAQLVDLTPAQLVDFKICGLPGAEGHQKPQEGEGQKASDRKGLALVGAAALVDSRKGPALSKRERAKEVLEMLNPSARSWDADKYEKAANRVRQALDRIDDD